MRLAPALVLLIVLAAPASAQSGTAFVQQATAELLTPTGDPLPPASLRSGADVSAAFPNIASGANAVILAQSGSGNTLDVEQTGFDNRAILSQTGYDNQTRLVQDGDRNIYDAAIYGDANDLAVNQIGSDNVYGLLMVGTNPAHTVNQIGDANVATQIVAPGLQPVNIDQQGNGLQVLVERF